MITWIRYEYNSYLNFTAVRMRRAGDAERIKEERLANRILVEMPEGKKRL
jgi:hypothetical protein